MSVCLSVRLSVCLCVVYALFRRRNRPRPHTSHKRDSHFVFLIFPCAYAHSGGSVARARNKSKSSDVPPQTVFFSIYTYIIYIYRCAQSRRNHRRYLQYIGTYIPRYTYTCPRHRLVLCLVARRSINLLLLFFVHPIFFFAAAARSRDLMICTISLLGPLRSNAAHHSRLL